MVLTPVPIPTCPGTHSTLLCAKWPYCAGVKGCSVRVLCVSTLAMGSMQNAYAQSITSIMDVVGWGVLRANRHHKRRHKRGNFRRHKRTPHPCTPSGRKGFLSHFAAAMSSEDLRDQRCSWLACCGRVVFTPVGPLLIRPSCSLSI